MNSLSVAPRPLVLVVEDDAAIAALLCDILEDHGYSCTTADGADGTLRILGTVRPALITLDLGLPGVSGGVLLQLLRGRPGLADIPVIIISAERVIAPELYDTCQAVLRKPFDVEQLLVTVRRVLDEHAAGDHEQAVGERSVKRATPDDATKNLGTSAPGSNQWGQGA